jgi:hypothetical protein
MGFLQNLDVIIANAGCLYSTFLRLLRVMPRRSFGPGGDQL